MSWSITWHGARLHEQRAGEERASGRLVHHISCCRWAPSDFEQVLADINQGLRSRAVFKGLRGRALPALDEPSMKQKTVLESMGVRLPVTKATPQWLKAAHFGGTAIEFLKTGEPPQRLKAAHFGGAAIEVLKASEAPQRPQVAHLGLAAVEALKLC